MKKFKTFFYPIYLIVIVLVLLMAFNIYESLELFKRWGWFKYFSDLPFMGRNLLVFLCVLMSLELIAENIALLNGAAKRRKLENEITSLKAKLYDKSEAEESNPEEPEADEEDGADDDED